MSKLATNINRFKLTFCRPHCSDDELKKFFDTQKNHQRQILITTEASVDGLEAEMVLFEEIHHVKIKSSYFRAKTKLATTFLSHDVHPAIKKQFTGVPNWQVKHSSCVPHEDPKPFINIILIH